MTVPLLLRYYPPVMLAMRFQRLAQCIALLTAAFVSCADRDDAVDGPSRSAAAAGSCISCAGTSAGEDSGGAAAGGQGPSGGPSTGGKAGSATAGTNAAAGVGTTPGGEGGGAGARPVSEELTLCDRLTQVQAKEEDLSLAFEQLAFVDCRVQWIPDLYVHPAQGPQMRKFYRYALERWNLRFWGCEGVPVETFELVWGQPPLSQGDVDILIDFYMQVAIDHLDLSPKEQSEMLAALKRLATVVITSDSLEPSQPRCAEGGAGGEGGATTASAGAAGEAAAGGAYNVGGAP